MCLEINEDNETIINENIFFDIYTYNEFVKSIYQLDKYKYLTEILKDAGMIIIDDNIEKNMLSKDDKLELKQNSLNKEYEKFNKFIMGEYINDQYLDNIKYLSLDFSNINLLEKYKDYIIDNNKIKNHDNTIYLLKNNDHNETKIKESINKKY